MLSSLEKSKMQPIEVRAGSSVGFKSEEGPWVFFCSDFPGSCCQECHDKNYLIVLYPWSIYSVGKRDRMPDLSLGLRAEVCCARFHFVRDLPREWWIKLYAKKHNWSEAEAERLAQSTPENYFRIWGDISNKRDGATVHRSTGTKRVTTAKNCPSCGDKWDGFTCNNCGHSG